MPIMRMTKIKEEGPHMIELAVNFTPLLGIIRRQEKISSLNVDENLRPYQKMD